MSFKFQGKTATGEVERLDKLIEKYRRRFEANNGDDRSAIEEARATVYGNVIADLEDLI